MPRMIALKCPNCNAPLQAPEDCERYFCQFCGTPVLVAAPGQNKRRDPASSRGVARPRPVPEQLQIEELGGELKLSYRWFTWGVLALIPFCIAWNAFLVGWYSMAGEMDGVPGGMRIIFLLFPIGHVAVGLGLIYAVLTMVLNRTTIRVRNGLLSIRHGPIYFPGNRTLPVDEIDQLYCRTSKSTGSKGGTQTSHTLHVRLKNGTSLKLLGCPLEGTLAAAVEQLVERHLGIRDRAVED